MSMEPKVKPLIVIISILLLSNIVLAAFLLFGQPREKKDGHRDRKAVIAEFLKIPQ